MSVDGQPLPEGVATLRVASADARERILETAYDLFSRYGTRAVGVDTIVAQAGVAKTTFYRHFPTKDDLIVEFLRRREERWTKEWLQGEVEARCDAPGDRLLAIFDVFHEWFQRPDYEGCSFINVVLEIEDRDSRVRRASVAHLSTIRELLAGYAVEAEIADPDGFARQWHILMKGSIVSAQEGDRDAALRARHVGELVLAEALRRKEPAAIAG
jgi:AcrR family transcriptional regulator